MLLSSSIGNLAVGPASASQNKFLEDQIGGNRLALADAGVEVSQRCLKVFNAFGPFTG